MGFKEDYLFWKSINLLIREYNYSLVTMSDDQNEVWLEHNETSHAYPVVRFMRYDFDWAAGLKKDLNRTVMNGENIRKQLFKRPISVLNVYITQFKPVDEYEMYIAQPITVNKTTIHTRMVDSEHAKEGLQHVGRELGIGFWANEEIPEDIEEQDIIALKQNAISSGIEQRQTEQKMFQYGKPIFTKVFLAIQIVIFLLMEIFGSSNSTITLVEFGAKYNPLILSGEWWRFITPMFIHIGFLHLLMNSLALFYIGSEVERIYGSARFVLVYLFAGFAGVLASFVMSPTLSAGASGAIFGCFGALLFFGIVKPKLFLRTMGMNIIVLILINLAFGFTVSGIDNSGHIGGLIGGFLAAAAVGVPKKWKAAYAIPAILVIVIGSFLLMDYGFDKQKQTSQDVPLTMLAQEYIQKKENDKAKAILEQSLEHGMISPTAEFLLGNLSIDEKDYDQAQAYYKKAIQLNPDFHQAHYNLALTYLQQQNIQEAIKESDAALKLQPDEESYQKLNEQLKELQ
ncbi:rhomboid family intramembrane serine protease [Bacillus testis]|uniref:rhomboid family intramembrane serine protease n=1 Tax=Bacillus testis TaxID=1622072 RepID=UPI00067EA695|nr:rhomboid family intramembrane serine protease [Bacillus testis]